MLKRKFLCKISYHCRQKILASLNVSLVLSQVCGPDDIIHLKLKKKWSPLGIPYISAFLDAKFLFLALLMAANQVVRNSSFWYSLDWS